MATPARAKYSSVSNRKNIQDLRNKKQIVQVEIGLKRSYFILPMLKLSKKTEYAIIAVLDMAIIDNGQLVTAKDLSQKYNLPRELLGKVLQSLAKEGLISSQQGVKGGYRLARSPEQIDFNLIIKAVEGPIHLVDCSVHDAETCSQMDYCNIKTPMEFIQFELTNFFKGITLKDITEKYAEIKPLLQIQG